MRDEERGNMLDGTLCRRDLEASATGRDAPRRPRRGHRTRAEPEQSADFRHPKASPQGPRYTSHDRTLRETRDLYVTTFHDGDYSLRSARSGCR